MNHPVDLLVDLVDGSIAPQDRAVVEAHLADCARCRRDVEFAAAGRQVARSLPSPEVPDGLADAAIAEAEHHAREVAPEVAPLRGGGRAGAPAWYRWAGAAAAAAAILLVVVIALPDVGGGGDEAQVGSAAEDAAFAPRAAETVEVLDLDLDTDQVQALALGYRANPDGVRADTGAAMPSEAVAGTDALTPKDVLSCLRTAIPELETQRPVRLIAARFEGTPAYLGVFLSGPGADQAPDTATVWVVARSGCEILSTTQASL